MTADPAPIPPADPMAPYSADAPLPEFHRIAERGGGTGHAVLDAVLAGLGERLVSAGGIGAEGDVTVAYYEDAP